MSVSLKESVALQKLAKHLYGFLPSSGFAAVAERVGVGHLWLAGSKLPAVGAVLERTLDKHRTLFCPLIVEIVRRGIAYNSRRGCPLTQEDVEILNELLRQVGFKIPELWKPGFLSTLPQAAKLDEEASTQDSEVLTQLALGELRSELLRLQGLTPVQRGFAFEDFLQDLFGLTGLSPRGSFRLVGEQIDGSCEAGGATYLIEAKWQDKPVGQADLLAFSGKVTRKSAWSRGLYISMSGFTDDGLQAFAKGEATNLIGISGQDLYLMLDERLSLSDMIAKKVRRAAESGEFYVPIRQLS